MLSDLVSKIYKTKWSQVNNFEVEINAIGKDAVSKVSKYKIPFKDCKLSINSSFRIKISLGLGNGIESSTYEPILFLYKVSEFKSIIV